MPRIIGIFADQGAGNEVIEQLEINGIDQTTILCASGQTVELAENSHAVAQELHAVRLPEAQAAEYEARLQRNQCLLLVEVSALDLPTVQRLFRNGQALDIDLLPETIT